MISLCRFFYFVTTKLKNFEKIDPEKSNSDGNNPKNLPKIMKNCSQGQGIDFYHAIYFSNLFRINGKVSEKTDFL